MSMLQEQSAPTAPEAEREEQESRTARYLATSPELLQMDEGIGGHRVAERGHVGEEPVFGNTNEAQEYVPTHAADTRRDDDVDFVRAQAVFGKQSPQKHCRGRKVGGEYLRLGVRRVLVIAAR